MNAFTKIFPCILSGGSGSRLWPLSRKSMPKQFLNLTGSNSLIQQTAIRARESGFRAPFIISGQDHRFIVAEQLRSIGIDDARIILEPAGRNTAPAAAVASLMVIEEDPDGLVLLLPSDHAILDAAAFQRAVDLAKPAAASGLLLAFGVTPLSPETGYGYIKAGDELASTPGVRDIETFVEKPSRENAERFLSSGNFFWNSGIYLFQAKAFIREMVKYQPEMLKFCRQALDRAKRDSNFIRLEEEAFLACPSDSIDYAITEKTNSSAVVPVDMRWSDVGSWNSLWNFLPHSDEGNVVRGDVVLCDTRNSYIHSEFPLVTASGVEDLVIVATKDAVFVSRREGTQGVKNIVEKLAHQGRSQAIEHSQAHRPWGTFDNIDSGPQFQVQQFMVEPGQKLPLQRHYKRAEHWTVVEGNALVTRGEERFILRHNESTFIPNGVIHSLENSGSSPLRMIKVLCGSYFGEDDSVRFEDTCVPTLD